MSLHQSTGAEPHVSDSSHADFSRFDHEDGEKFDFQAIQRCLVSSGYSFNIEPATGTEKGATTWMWSLFGSSAFDGFASEALAVRHAWICAQEGVMDALLPKASSSTRDEYWRSLPLGQKIRLAKTCFTFGEPSVVAPLPDDCEIDEIGEDCMTDWQPGDSVPAMDGVYLRDFGDGEATSHFCEGKWRRDGFFVSPEQGLPWRGLIMRPPMQAPFA